MLQITSLIGSSTFKIYAMELTIAEGDLCRRWTMAKYYDAVKGAAETVLWEGLLEDVDRVINA